jgi:hypothetical protein
VCGGFETFVRRSCVVLASSAWSLVMFLLVRWPPAACRSAPRALERVAARLRTSPRAVPGVSVIAVIIEGPLPAGRVLVCRESCLASGLALGCGALLLRASARRGARVCPTSMQPPRCAENL